MEQRRSSDANSYSASHEIPCTLWKPKVHYCIHKRPPLVPYPEPDHIQEKSFNYLFPEQLILILIFLFRELCSSTTPPRTPAATLKNYSFPARLTAKLAY